MKSLLPFAMLFVAFPATADLDSAMDDLCAKIKTCGMQQAEAQGLPPEMKAMMEGMVDGMCKTWMQPYAKSIGDAGLEKKAEACVDSVVDTSCETMMQAQGEFKTEACEDFEKAADEAGLDLSN